MYVQTEHLSKQQLEIWGLHRVLGPSRALVLIGVRILIGSWVSFFRYAANFHVEKIMLLDFFVNELSYRKSFFIFYIKYNWYISLLR